jgi:hypothetical protein
MLRRISLVEPLDVVDCSAADGGAVRARLAKEAARRGEGRDEQREGEDRYA